MNRIVIVTGARGFLGRHTSRLLARRGFLVAGIGHGFWQPEDYSLWGLRSWYEGEITATTLRNCAESPHAILHCAGGGSVPASLQEPLADFERSVLTTAHVLNFVRLSSPSTRVIYPSSASVYGNATHLPIIEDSKPMPVSPYGIHKWLAEQVVTMYAKQFQISSSIVRFFSVYGPCLRKQLLWDACNKMSRGESLFAGTGNELRDWLHVEDAAQLMILAMDNSSAECPVINGGTGTGTSVRDILTKLGARLVPGQIVPTFSGFARGGDPTSFVADTARSQAWGFAPTRCLEDGIAGYVDWWRCESQLRR